MILSGCFLVFDADAQVPQSPPAAYDPSNTFINFVRTWEPTKPETNPNLLLGAPLREVKQTTAYFDGLGRPIQNVIKEGSIETSSGTRRDMVSSFVYDQFNRTIYGYLPFASTAVDGSGQNGLFKYNPFQQQVLFYNSYLQGQSNETNVGPEGLNWAYGKKEYESSPIGRELHSYEPGSSWVKQGRGIANKYWFNTAADDVKVWKVAGGILGNNYGLQVTPTFTASGTRMVYYYWDNVPFLSTVNLLYRTPGSGWNSSAGSPVSPRSWEIPDGNYEYAVQFIFSDGRPPALVKANTTNPDISLDYYVNGTYPAGTLSKMVTIDENNKQTISFYDHEGKILLKKSQLIAANDDGSGSGYLGWVCTYYVYDEYDNCRLVIQPKGVEILASNGWAVHAGNDVILNEQAFIYNYDDRQRMISKKLPGANVVEMIYDSYDRLALTQDGNLRTMQQWSYMVYDEFSRIVSTGLITDPANYDNPTFHRSIANGASNYPDLNIYTSQELTRTFYDDYSWRNQYGDPLSNVLDNSMSSHFITPANTYPYPQALNQTQDLKGLITGTRVNVLGTADYLYTVKIYDEKGLMIQVQSTNITGGTDITTTQYSWMAHPLVSVEKVQNSAIANSYLTKTTFSYDDLWRPLNVSKSIYNVEIGTAVADVILAANEYDALGRLRNKKLAPGYKDGEGLETLTHEYNVRGWLFAVNRGWLLPESDPNYVNRKFGFQLGYDQVDVAAAGTAFSNPTYNGNISGTVWKSFGNGIHRKYDFAYDPLSRLLKADFLQSESGSSWDNKIVDYSFNVGNGTNDGSAYDANGNILQLAQRGLKAGSSDWIDKLTYSYFPNSNRLKDVVDDVIVVNNLDDFTDKNLTTDDFEYDASGNLVVDKNKKITSIEYNFLNLPYRIHVNNNDDTYRGYIEYSYDAAGTKLKKLVHEFPSASNNNTERVSEFTYIGKCNFESSESYGPDGESNSPDQLQFIQHEEGRTREVRDADGVPITFAFDYFVKDQVGNVRMILTDEEKSDVYFETMETAMDEFENKIFINRTNIVDKPACFDSESKNEKVQKVSAGDVDKPIVVGSGIVLKVMAGDYINAKVFGWLNDSESNGDPASSPPLKELLANLFTNGIAKVSGKAASSNITAELLIPGISDFLGTQSNYEEEESAYLNWVLLDEEQLRLVEGAHGFTSLAAQQESGGEGECPSNKALLQMNDGDGLTILKNGYIYIYVSNTNKRFPAYFDDLYVEHKRGILVEESHYYPFGLIQQGISSKAFVFGGAENRYKFNSAELNTAFDLNSYEFFYRTYDPQIGRWHGLDTKPNEAVSLYASMLNNPIRFSDPLGDTVAVFRPDGTFWKFQDDGKTEWSGMFYQKSEVTSTFEKDGVTYEVRTYSEGQAFKFNDPAVDVQGIKNGVINRIEIGTDAMIDKAMNESGVKGVAKSDGLAFALREGKGGKKMDYGIAGINRGDFNKNTLYLKGGKAYNVADWGNFLFGRGMAYLEVALGTAQIGAHYNNFWNGFVGKKDHTPHYDFGPDTYGAAGVFDSKSDQQALIDGYKSHPDYKNIIRRYYQSWPKYNPK